MTCPKCSGCLEGPEWDLTLQGKVLQVRCVNCGFRAFHPTSYVDYTEKKEHTEVIRHKNSIVIYNSTTNRMSTVRDLSKYVFTE